jgi:hypothetical protein
MAARGKTALLQDNVEAQLNRLLQQVFLISFSFTSSFSISSFSVERSRRVT